MHPVEDENVPSRSQTEDAIGGWRPTFGPRSKSSGSTGTGLTAHVGARQSVHVSGTPVCMGGSCDGHPSAGLVSGRVDTSCFTPVS